MFGFRKSSKKTNGASPEALQQCSALLEDLSGQMSDNSASQPIRTAIRSALDSGPFEQINRLAPTYLLAERHLTGADDEESGSLEEFRASVRARYPALQTLAEFSVITAPAEEQSLSLARGFLQEVIQNLPKKFGQGPGVVRPKLSKWLSRLPNAEIADFPIEGIRTDLADTDSLTERLRIISKRLFTWAGARFNPRAADLAFQRAYDDYLKRFRALDAFEIVVSLLPSEMLGEEHVDAMNRRQVERILINRTAHYREISGELADRNVELEQAKAALEQSKLKSDESARMLNLVLSAVADGIVAMDSAGKIIMVNPTFEKIWGYREAEVKGQHFASLIPDKLAENPETDVRRMLDAAHPKMMGMQLELQGIRKNGQTFPAGITFSNAEVDGESIFTASVQDITMRKYIQDELASSKDQLQERVDESTKDLLETQDALLARARELERTNHELEQFAYVASHDLQEPLRTITSFIQILNRRHGDKLGEEAGEYMDFVVDGAKRMQGLINELLEYSRAGRTKGPMRLIDLNQVIENVRSNLHVRIEESDCKLVVQDMPKVMGDSRQLLQLFQNLTDNAIKFKSDDPPEVHISCEEHPDHWLIGVADNGIGIREKYKDRVFIIFQRLHTRDEYSGNGIGLAICKKIIELHGGKIWLDTNYEDGCRFWFRLSKEAASELAG